MDAHPSARRLVAYSRAGLTDDECVEMREHLSLCPHCTRIVLDLSGSAVGELDATLAAGWRSTLTRLEAAGLGGNRPSRRGPGGSGRLATTSLWLRLAASLTLLLAGWGVSQWHSRRVARATEERLLERVAGLDHEREGLAGRLEAAGERIARLEDQLSELSGPQSRVGVVDLVPVAFSRRGNPSVQRVRVPVDARFVFVRMLIAEPVTAPGLRLRILDATGAELLVLAGLRQDERGRVALALPSDALEPGRYALRLSAEGPRDRVVGRYTLEVERENGKEPGAAGE